VKLLHFDPGANTGWALVEEVGSKIVLLKTGTFHFDSTTFSLDAFAPLAEADAVSIETIQFVYPKEFQANRKGIPARMATNLVETGRLEVRIEMEARRRGKTVLTFAERAWRQRIFGWDADASAVKKRLTLLMMNVPVRSNEHERDAMGGALYAVQTLRLERAAKRAQRSGTGT
jgi:Holliday junction resolvasome RuvABC endonuclease subunit